MDIQVTRFMLARAIGAALKFEGAELEAASTHIDLGGGTREWEDSAPRAMVFVGGAWNFAASEGARMTEEGGGGGRATTSRLRSP